MVQARGQEVDPEPEKSDAEKCIELEKSLGLGTGSTVSENIIATTKIQNNLWSL